MRTVDSREERIFLNAIDLESDAERTVFLEKECADSPSLRRRIEDLLALHNSHDFILDDTHGYQETQQPVLVEDSGTVGNYRLVKKLGSGGMGDVYLAEQTYPVQRRVALKIVRFGNESRNVIRRFEAERQTLALMEHPCITKVFDAGMSPHGRPFFAMELVNGESITDFCNQQRLQIQERLAIFSQVCHAVQHAHEKGVIHRDLKPSNVLVTERDGQPLPKIIDFGIAKATTAAANHGGKITKNTVLIGTPEYMSPEQANGQRDVDTRTDVYSLGAILFELCCGETPFHQDIDQQNLLELRNLIQSTHPALPSERIAQSPDREQICRERRTGIRTLQRTVHGELDWIVMKCLSKDRQQRYSSPLELADDINRFLKGEMIEAASPTWSYRFAKFARRRRTVLLAAACVLLLMVLSSFISIRFAISAQKAADRAIHAEAKAHDELRKAQRIRGMIELERHRNRFLESSNNQKFRAQLEATAIARAIAKYNRLILDNAALAKPGISAWSRNQLGELGTMLPPPRVDGPLEPAQTLKADLHLMELVLHEKKEMLGESDLSVADTLDDLGGHLLNLGDIDASIKYSRQSLIIRSKIAPESDERIRTMIRLAKGLRLKKRIAEAQSHLEAARRRLGGKTASNLHAMVDAELAAL